MKLNLDGDSLNSMKAEDLVARIIYRSQNQQSTNISFTINKTDSSDKAVSGFYEHSFEISDIKIDKSLGNTAELSFELALDGISLTDFPTGFLVELYSNGKDSNSKPFTYTSSFSFETKEEQNNPDPEPTPTPTPQPEPQPEPELYALAVNSGAGIASVEGAGDYKAGESITVKCSIKDGYEFDSWSGDKTGSTNELTFNMPESNVTITANAKVITYNIAFNLDDGQTTEDNPVSYDVTSATITLKNPTKTGYTFVGWSGTGLTGNTNKSKL